MLPTRKFSIEFLTSAFWLQRAATRCWRLLGHECQIPNEYDYITAYMGEDPVIVSRLPNGSITANLNICRHRGNRVSQLDYLGDTRYARNVHRRHHVLDDYWLPAYR